jgi:hypothetical protein
MIKVIVVDVILAGRRPPPADDPAGRSEES